MAEDLFDWKEIYFIEIAESRYGCEFISIYLEQNKVRLGFILWKSQNKVRLKIYFIEKVKIRYRLGLIHWKDQNKARLETDFIEHEKIRYGCGFISLKMLKWLFHSWGFIPFKMLKYFTAKDLFHLKCWDKV